MAKTCFFRHVELAEKPNKKSKKRVANGSVCKLERHFFLLTKVSADQTSYNINAKDNMMSPN